MHTTLDCLECLVRQSLRVSRMVTDDRGAHQQIMHRVLVHLSNADLSRSPTEISSTISRIIHEVGGSADPYEENKRRFNDLALDMLPGLERRVEAAADPWDAAVRLALAGNIIDFGGGRDVDERDVLETIETSLVDPISGMSPADARLHVDRAESILYVGDNAGEIVFDRLLVERIGPDRITFVVRGSPIINDATISDARAVGLTDLVRVIDTGWDGPGAPPRMCGPAFREALERASLVISKGQGNYETMSGIARPILFLLRAKCPVVADHIGVAHGAMVISGRNL
jgi:uncharacterized protein with ATP-grasp and redox domains